MTKEPKNPSNLPAPPDAEFLLYTTEDGQIRIECRFSDETIWLSQRLMAELLDKDVRTINEHLQNLYEEGEIAPEATIRKFRIVRTEGERDVTRIIEHYNLQAILAVGFRVRSRRGVQFRQWANVRLQEYLVKGFVMDDQRLKNPPVDGQGIPDYFDELLERIRDIRASEKRVYLRVRELFALAADYKPISSETRKFFKIIQNKLHFAATGKTAAELIASRARGSKKNMGLTSWKNSPGGQILKSDIGTAKNYLTKKEIQELNRIVVMWLDFAEDQALRRQQFFLTNWEEKLDAFLQFNEREILSNAGQVSQKQARALAEKEYVKFAKKRKKLLEAEGERANIKALTEQEKKLTSDKDKS